MKPPQRKRNRPAWGRDEDDDIKKGKAGPVKKKVAKTKVQKQEQNTPTKSAEKGSEMKTVPNLKTKAAEKSSEMKTVPNLKTSTPDSQTSQESTSPRKNSKKRANSTSLEGPPQKKTKATESVSSPVKWTPSKEIKERLQAATIAWKARKDKEARERVRKVNHTSVKKKKQASKNGGNEQTTDKMDGAALRVHEVENARELQDSSEDSVCGKPSGKFVGAHVSIAKGLDHSVINALNIGAKSFALFLRSQRQWVSKPMDEEVAEKFKENCKQHGFPPHLIIPHGSYLMNCGSPDAEVLKKSRAALVEDLNRCEMLGLTMFNFHPGSSCGEISVEECLDKIGDSINYAHERSMQVITVIENMSCQGNTIGGKFEELRGIIDRVEDKSRIGICFDTCHAFAAGHDISTEEGYEKVMTEFDRIVGFKYLKAVHMNDSMGGLGCHQDRHENIGKGKIGLQAFKCLMNDPRFDNIPLVLETPAGVRYAEEIQILYSMLEDRCKNKTSHSRDTSGTNLQS